MDYLLQEPRYLHLKFVWRITRILKKKMQFLPAEINIIRYMKRVKTEFLSSKLVRYSKQISNANISAPVRDNPSKFSLRARHEYDLLKIRTRSQIRTKIGPLATNGPNRTNCPNSDHNGSHVLMIWWARSLKCQLWFRSDKSRCWNPVLEPCDRALLCWSLDILKYMW